MMDIKEKIMMRFGVRANEITSKYRFEFDEDNRRINIYAPRKASGIGYEVKINHNGKIKYKEVNMQSDEGAFEAWSLAAYIACEGKYGVRLSLVPDGTRAKNLSEYDFWNWNDDDGPRRHYGRK